MMPRMRGPSTRSPGTTNDRITVHIAEDTTPAELQAVARAVATKFDLSLTEAEALLRADVIVLGQDEAEALVAICQRLGIRGKMTKPKPAVSRAARLKRQTLPWLLALLGVVAMVTLVSLVLPEVTVSSDTGASRTAPAEPVQKAAVTDTPRADAETSPESALPRIASATADVGTVVETVSEDAQQTSASAVPVIASAPAENADTDLSASPENPAEAPDLFTAARDLTPAEVEQALETARVDTRDAYGQTPLMYAAGSNTRAVVTALLAAGADVNAASDAGWTPLMYAARNTNAPEVVQTLLAAGADAAVRNESGQGARDIALAYNNSAAATIPAPSLSATATSSAQDARPVNSQTVPTRAVATPTALPAAPAPTVGGGRPITITPRPFPVPSFPPPVAVPAPAETASGPLPLWTEPGPAPFQPAPQERDIILDCLQNWDACGN